MIFISQYLFNLYSNLQRCLCMTTHMHTCFHSHTGTRIQSDTHQIKSSARTTARLGLDQSVHTGMGVWREPGAHGPTTSQRERERERKQRPSWPDCSSRQLRTVKSSSHSLTCCTQALEVTHRGGVNDWGLCLLQVDTRNHAAVKRSIQSTGCFAPSLAGWINTFAKSNSIWFTMHIQFLHVLP